MSKNYVYSKTCMCFRLIYVFYLKKHFTLIKRYFCYDSKVNLFFRLKIYEPQRKKKSNTQFNVFSEAVFNMVFCRLDFSGSFFFGGSSFSIFDLQRWTYLRQKPFFPEKTQSVEK